MRGQARWAEWLRARRGAVAPVFAILAVPLIVGGGVAIDLYRGESNQVRLQDALDAAGLAVARLPANTPAATIQTDAQSWISANIAGSTLLNVAVAATVSGQTVTLTATASTPTTMMSMVGFNAMANNTSTTVSWGISKVEVALVLDNTGSMQEDNKLPTLISSAKTLVSTLFSQNTSGDSSAVKISVVPFTNTVNIGSSYQNATWMSGVLPTAYQTALNAAYSGLDWSLGPDVFTQSNVNRFTLFSQMGTAWGGCVESRPAPYDAQDTAPTSSNPATLFVPYFSPDNPDDTVLYGGQTLAAYPNSYLTDLAADAGLPWYQRQADAAKYTTAPATGSYPGVWNIAELNYKLGPNTGCQIEPLLRLSSDESAIDSEIDGMTAAGETNLNIGFMWGWHVLSPNAPFGDGAAYGTPNVIKIVVFLTDGWNESTVIPDGAGLTGANGNTSFYSGTGYIWQNRTGVGRSATQAQRQSALDSRTLAACQNAKAAGITVYTVRIDVAGSQSPAVLESCATSSSDFYDVQDVSKLPQAFAQIAGQIGGLRVAH